MHAAVIQLQSGDQISENLNQASQVIESANARGARLVVLPEGFAFLGAETEKAQHAEDLSGDGPILLMLRKHAKRHGIWIIGGGMPERSEDSARPYNTSVLLSPSGDVVERYRKIHLFDVELSDGTVLTESRGNLSGTDPVVAQVEEHCLGMSICYDVRFPELYRVLRRSGATLLSMTAAFTKTTGEAHFTTLLRARAIENQAYLLAAAQWGEHPLGRKTYGHSAVIDPWGRVVAELPSGVGFVSADLDLEEVKSVRTQMPIDSHRRLVD